MMNIRRYLKAFKRGAYLAITGTSTQQRDQREQATTINVAPTTWTHHAERPRKGISQ